MFRQLRIQKNYLGSLRNDTLDLLGGYGGLGMPRGLFLRTDRYPSLLVLSRAQKLEYDGRNPKVSDLTAQITTGVEI